MIMHKSQILGENSDLLDGILDNLTREAFWNVNVPGCDEHYLAHTLRQAPAYVAELDFVAEYEGIIAGNIMYARAGIHTEQGKARKVLTFGPVSVLPRHQGRGIGSALIRQTLSLAKELGYRAVVIYGDPRFYQRFGFVAGEEAGIRTMDGLFSPALQALELVPGALEEMRGRFDEGDAYRLDYEAAAEFEKGFPPRAKEVTASQARFLELLSLAHE